MDIKAYKKEADYSYTLGAFPTFELLDAMPEHVEEIIVHSSFTDRAKLEEKAAAVYEERRNRKDQTRVGSPVKIVENDKLISKLSDKENVYVIGVFRKFESRLDQTCRHIVLVNPGNMGNLGTIIRTACGFGYFDLAVIEPAADIFNPKTIRASMGSLFRIRHEKFADFDEYAKRYCGKDTCNEGRLLYPFMLDGSSSLNAVEKPGSERFSLIFGNEATGLPHAFSDYGQPVRIEQNEFVDSLNLTIAAGIGMYMFAQGM